MNVSELATAVKRQFGDETGAQITDADILRWINEGQLKIVRRTEALDDSYVVAFDGSEGYTLPTTFVKDISVEISSRLIQRTSEGEMNVFFPDRGTMAAGGVPTRYWIDTKLIRFYPRPSTGSALLRFIARPTIIAAIAGELGISQMYHQTLLSFCLAEAALLDGDMDKHQALISRFNGELSEDSHDAKHTSEMTYPAIRPSLGDIY